jgi:hypothetical protein
MRRWRTIRGAAAVLAAAAWAGPAAAAPADGRLIEGELVRVDLARRTLVVRPAGEPRREVDVKLDAATVITISGRSVPVEDLKPVERIVVACEGESAASCRARRVRAGPARHLVPPAALP